MIANDRQKIASGDFSRNKLFHFVRMMKKKSVQFFKGVVQVFGHILVGERKKVVGNEEKKKKNINSVQTLNIKLIFK